MSRNLISISVSLLILLVASTLNQQTMEFMDEHPFIRSILEYDQFFKQALAGG